MSSLNTAFPYTWLPSGPTDSRGCLRGSATPDLLLIRSISGFSGNRRRSGPLRGGKICFRLRHLRPSCTPAKSTRPGLSFANSPARVYERRRGAADGHATADSGVLLAVTVADCVPIYLLDVDARAVALLHGGWRGIAAGILQRGITLLGARWGTDPRRLLVHLGPAICGACYEVGPEVFDALGVEVPSRAAPIDVRGVLAQQARAAGVPPESITVSGVCTLCGDGNLFSHRGGRSERQVAFLGIRP